MDRPDWLTGQFEEHRAHLRDVAYRMLGSAMDAEDAVQESWIRLGRADADAIANLRAWLTTVVARVCMDMLRARSARRENALDARVPDPILTRLDADPEAHAILANNVGLALLIVMESLDPAERLAFVLHDVFGLTFDEIAPLVDRSPVATRQLASRARRRVQTSTTTPERNLTAQRRVVDAFVAAARDGDFDKLLAVFHPDVVLRADGGPLAGATRVVRGAQAVIQQAERFSKIGLSNELVLVNGSLGFLSRLPDGRLFSVVAFTIAGGKIVEMNILADPERLSALDLSSVE